MFDSKTTHVTFLLIHSHQIWCFDVINQSRLWLHLLSERKYKTENKIKILNKCSADDKIHIYRSLVGKTLLKKVLRITGWSLERNEETSNKWVGLFLKGSRRPLALGCTWWKKKVLRFEMMFHDAELSTIAVFFYRSCTCCDCRWRKIVHAVWFLHFFLTLYTVRHEQVLQSEQYLSLFLVFLFFFHPCKIKGVKYLFSSCFRSRFPRDVDYS